jgi:hypothetical protein
MKQEHNQLAAQDYANVRAAGQQALADHRLCPELPPEDGELRWGISAVFRPAPEQGEPFLRLIETLKSLGGPDQFWYPADGLHSTIHSIEPFRFDVLPSDKSVAIYADALKDAAVKTVKARSVDITYRGISASPAGVIAQGWPVTDDLIRLRHAFHENLKMQGDICDVIKDRIRRTAHISLGVFRHPLLADHAAFAQFINDHADHPFGTLRFDQIDIVHYRFEKGSNIKVINLVRLPL